MRLVAPGGYSRMPSSTVARMISSTSSPATTTGPLHQVMPVHRASVQAGAFDGPLRPGLDQLGEAGGGAAQLNSGTTGLPNWCPNLTMSFVIYCGKFSRSHTAVISSCSPQADSGADERIAGLVVLQC